MIKSRISKFGVLATSILAIPALSLAGTPAKESKKIVEKTKESCITGDIGMDAYSQYVFHGITLENQGAILQPYANIYFNLYEGAGFLNNVSLNLGVWNSFHSNHTVASSTRNWFEFDFLAGLSFTFGKYFTLSPGYVAYTSPGDYFSTAHVAQLKLSVDDSDFLGAWALNPYVMVEAELDGKAGNGTDEGFYYEVGIAPGCKAGPVAISLPIKAGFGSNDYYAENAGYGFFSAGVALGYDLAFVPECYGTWTVSASATYFNYGDANASASASTNPVKTAEVNAVVFGGGLKVAF
ncbi:MAG: hypothetical protein DVB27_03570 [Verrucomicrobia bacterium]|nr:MAG: hypothetical protein DVB27_03570 [Verrucomicrobiota bacterium]